ncbi:MAG: hypothetical protein AB8G05_23115 [Oligoflexales bacterium]
MRVLTKKNQNYLAMILIVLAILFISAIALANNLPGQGSIADFTAAQTLLHIVDSVLFNYGAKLAAGLCILAAGWNLKEQRFNMAIICVIAAIVIGTTPMWIKNIFEMSASGGGSIFNTGGGN